jgi:purine-nucleoside phosphorylase
MTPSGDQRCTDAVEAADFLRTRIPWTPQAAILTGTGLGEMTSGMQIHARIAYENIPNFPRSTVQSHLGQLVAGMLAHRPVVVLQGRVHLYEGYSSREVAFCIRVLQELGVGTLIQTNASGGLNPDFSAGDIMVIADHINLTGTNPLMGPNNERWGPRFPDMTAAYSPVLRRLAGTVARQQGIMVRSGVYVGLHGPSLETPAEMRFLRTIGADAVGFSTVTETLAAVHAGMQVLGLSIITNMNLPDNLMPASVDAIIARARAVAPGLERIVAGVLESGEIDAQVRSKR